MNLLDHLYETVPWFGYLASIALLLGAMEAGRRIGQARRRWGIETKTFEITTLETATLGLLALMIGFTFSVALNRFDTRRGLLIDEANAIGTAELRARLLPEPHAAEAQRLLRAYVQVRIDLITRWKERQPGYLEVAIERSNALQGKLWDQAIAVTTSDPHSIVAGLFVQALNEMFDLQAKRVAAANLHAPIPVFVLLYTIAIVAAGFTGYSAGLVGRPRRVPSIVAVVLIAIVIGLVGDIDRPNQGYVTVSQKPMLDLMAGFMKVGP